MQQPKTDSADPAEKQQRRGKKGMQETPPPLPPKVRKALSKVEHCRAELAAVYREARAGRLDIANASKLGNILSLLARMIESGDVERRVEALEQLLKGGDK